MNLGKGTNRRLTISFCQIYNDEIYDLLTPVDYSKKLKLKETAEKGREKVTKGLIVDGLSEVTIKNVGQVSKLVSEVQKNRFIASTQCNKRSSRSHCIYSIKLWKGGEVSARFVVVDLAGSERINSKK